MADVPSLREELDRKVFEALEDLVNAPSTGRMSAAEVSGGVKTLFTAVSGLVDNKFIEIITGLSELCGAGGAEKRIFIKDGEVVKLSWSPGASTIMRQFYTFGALVKGDVKQYSSVSDAAHIFRNCGTNFTTKGWEEL